MNIKPMLAVDCGGVESVVFPVYASTKLDGVRCIIADGVALSRTLKPIPNKRVQALLDGLPVGLDGELIAGDPTAPDAYRKTVSMVMADDKPIDGLLFRIFDIQEAGTFDARYSRLLDIFGVLFEEMRPGVCLVPQVHVATPGHLRELEELWVTEGYEGAILRAPNSPYKHGRSTVREGYLLKLKRFVDSEAEVIGVTELMHNGNEKTVNELGRTARSSHKAGKTGMGVLGALQVRDCTTGVEFEIGTGFTADERRTLWQESKLPNRIWSLAKYKYFPVGSKDKPRFPVFLGWRSREDV